MPCRPRCGALRAAKRAFASGEAAPGLGDPASGGWTGERRGCRGFLRWPRERQIPRLRGLAHEAGLDPQFAEKFITFVIAEVIRHHEALASEPGTAQKSADPA